MPPKVTTSPRVFVGTSGYSYSDWHGPFYPADLPARDRLDFYLTRFRLVEVNSTYYRMPSRKSIEGIAARCGPHAGADRLTPVCVKLPAEITHDRPAARTALAEALSRFLDAVAPLLESDAAIRPLVLAQFPFSFRYDPGNRSYLDALTRGLSVLGAWRTIVEFRNRVWTRPRVSDGLRERCVIPAVIDLPRLDGLPESLVAPDGVPDLYLRCHGRNATRWWTGDATTRYDYQYDGSELERIRDLVIAHLAASAVGTAYVAFNNHFRGNAADNAQQLRTLLVDAGVDAA